MTPRRILIVLLLVSMPVLFLYGDLTAQSTDPAQLFVCQDEASIERKIHAYLKTKHDWDGEILEIEDSDGDIYIEYALAPEGCPEMTVFVDTDSTETGDEGNILERRIEIWSYYEVPDKYKTPEYRQKLLELNNKWMQDYWMPSGVYIDEDGDIAFQTNLNIPLLTVSVHAELVYDVLARTQNSWKDYWPEFKKTVGME
jgi:hypothetical protein